MSSSFNLAPSETGASPSSERHRQEAPDTVRVAVLTISDTRTREDDRSGEIIRQHLIWRGHTIAEYVIVPDNERQIVSTLLPWIENDAIDAIVTNGGTGIAGRDTTYEAIAGLLDKELPGFGELFRMLSYEEIGAAAMLSRAIAGVASDTAVFTTPGSSNAVKLAMEKLIAPEIAHIVHEIRKQQ